MKLYPIEQLAADGSETLNNEYSNIIAMCEEGEVRRDACFLVHKNEAKYAFQSTLAINAKEKEAQDGMEDINDMQVVLAEGEAPFAEDLFGAAAIIMEERNKITND